MCPPEFYFWCDSGPQNRNYISSSNVDSSPELFIWGPSPFKLSQLTQIHEVVTVHSQSHGHVPQARLGLPSCQGGAGSSGPEARSRGRSMAGHIECPACHRGRAREDSLPQLAPANGDKSPSPASVASTIQKSRILMPSVASLLDKLLQLDQRAQASVSRGQGI